MNPETKEIAQADLLDLLFFTDFYKFISVAQASFLRSSCSSRDGLDEFEDFRGFQLLKPT